MTYRKDYTKYTIDRWYKLVLQVNNGYHMEEYDKLEMLRLNHLIMETCHDVYNDSMLRKDR